MGGGRPQERYPHAGDGGGRVQLPAVGLPVPAGLGPCDLGVDGGMGHYAGLCVLLVPHSALGEQHG
jgi:hypothetical protein